MSDEIVFYTHPMSRGRIVRWMLEEVGQPYRAEILGYADSMKAPAYLAINPMGKVPALKHGDTVVTEGAAICAYLADAFPQANLAPAVSSALRGPYYRWLFFAAGPVESAVTNKSMGFEVPAERRRLAGYGCYEDTVDALEAATPKDGWWLGEQFTAADVYVGSQIAWGLQFGSIDKRPLFEAYAARLATRPAFQRAHQTDDALIAEMQKQAEPA
jgi:glutathione S-transferase